MRQKRIHLFSIECTQKNTCDRITQNPNEKVDGLSILDFYCIFAISAPKWWETHRAGICIIYTYIRVGVSRWVWVRLFARVWGGGWGSGSQLIVTHTTFMSWVDPRNLNFIWACTQRNKCLQYTCVFQGRVVTDSTSWLLASIPYIRYWWKKYIIILYMFSYYIFLNL